MTTRHYFVRLLGTREGWPENMTDREQQVLEEHYRYLKDLTMKKKVVAAGPVWDPPFGLVILQVGSEEEARSIMDDEPSVVAGVHTYEMRPFNLSLLADYRSPLRYLEQPTDRVLQKQVTVAASLDDVWRLWTTSEGMESFLCEKANIELRPGGPYEIYFSMEAPEGLRGSEDCTILSYLPKRMLSFEWNAPPGFPTRRDYERTWVVIDFDEIQPGQVTVTLHHYGWGTGEDWDGVYDYFDAAWGSVLEAMSRYLEGKE